MSYTSKASGQFLHINYLYKVHNITTSYIILEETKRDTDRKDSKKSYDIFEKNISSSPNKLVMVRVKEIDKNLDATKLVVREKKL